MFAPACSGAAKYSSVHTPFPEKKVKPASGALESGSRSGPMQIGSRGVPFTLALSSRPSPLDTPPPAFPFVVRTPSVYVPLAGTCLRVLSCHPTGPHRTVTERSGRRGPARPGLSTTTTINLEHAGMAPAPSRSMRPYRSPRRPPVSSPTAVASACEATRT